MNSGSGGFSDILNSFGNRGSGGSSGFGGGSSGGSGLTGWFKQQIFRLI